MADKRTGSGLRIEFGVLLGLNAMLITLSLLWFFA
jgi:hypothetical protein|tara:strand:- start:379 stop:483 length:105 start_codon:yes stop_codon:yes gene_type:complete